MLRKKIKIRFALLAVLTALTMIAFWWIQPENRLDVSADIFRLRELSAINTVELKSDSGSVVLAYDGTKWRVNDRYDADASMIRVLFATLQQAQPRRAAPQRLQDSLFSHLAARGTTVSLFEGDQLRKKFFAGGNATKTQAFFADPDTRRVYVMNIPGYRVYVSGILQLGESAWRDKYVFPFNWQNFKSLEVLFPEKPSDNFTVSMKGQLFAVEELPETDTARLNSYLDNVSLLTVEEYISEPGLSDGLQQQLPAIEIRVSDVANRTYRLRLFEYGPDKEVFGLIQESQVALFARRKFLALSKSRSFFSKK